MRTIDEVIKEYGPSIRKIKGIIEVNVGMHEGKQCIFLHVEKKDPELSKEVSKYIEGHRVNFIIKGSIEIF